MNAEKFVIKLNSEDALYQLLFHEPNALLDPMPLLSERNINVFRLFPVFIEKTGMIFQKEVVHPF